MGALFRMAHSPPVTSLSPHFYGLLVVRYSLWFPLRTFRARLTSKAISIFNFQGPPGCGSRSLSEVGRCRDNSVSYFRAKVYGLVVQVTHPLSPYIVYNSPKKQKIPPEKQNLRFALRRDVFRHDCYKFKKALDLKSILRIILNLSKKFLPLLCGRHDDKEEFIIIADRQKSHRHDRTPCFLLFLQ